MHPHRHHPNPPRRGHPLRHRLPHRLAPRHLPPLLRRRPPRRPARTGPVPRQTPQRHTPHPLPHLRTPLPPRNRPPPQRPTRHGQRIRRRLGQHRRQIGAHLVRVPKSLFVRGGNVSGIGGEAHRPAGDVGGAAIDAVAGVDGHVRLYAVGGEASGEEGGFFGVFEFVDGDCWGGVRDGGDGDGVFGQFGAGGGEEDGLAVDNGIWM
mmetsp:Transcript_29586/g.62190  ORF Transcript_29586/g.62190 Transcript_29586/m.62190 type:complete len:207 (-) Transcript_29586:432-1052(-)